MIHVWMRATVDWLDEDAFWAQMAPRTWDRFQAASSFTRWRKTWKGISSTSFQSSALGLNRGATWAQNASSSSQSTVSRTQKWITSP